MKRSTKLVTVGLAGVTLLASLILIINVLLPKLEKEENKEDLKTILETMAIDHYENHFKSVMPDYLDNYGSLTITLDYLQSVKKDISEFEKYSCDYNKTYVEFIKDGDKGEYKTEVTLDCNFE